MRCPAPTARLFRLTTYDLRVTSYVRRSSTGRPIFGTARKVLEVCHGRRGKLLRLSACVRVSVRGAALCLA
eukprot:2037405-Prymnesium_polylepis.1